MANGRPTGSQLFAGIVTLVLAGVTAAHAWTFTTVMSHGERLGKVETSNIVSAEWLKERLDRFQVQLDRIEGNQKGN